jgi:deoxyribonuclease-4
MFRIGCHLSVAKGYLDMGRTASSIGANTFQFFTRNPRGGSARAIDPEDVRKFLEFSENNDIKHILAHASYTLNGASADPGVRRFATESMADDLKRMEFTPGNCYNLHPGSHVGQGLEKGIGLVIDMLDSVMEESQTTTVLLETMAGKGSEIGRTFEELRNIIDGVAMQDRIGVCLDTCHVFDAGYDIVNDLGGVLDEFNDILGLERLKAVHINDSINGAGSHKDRHARIGEGSIGLEAMVRIINEPRLRRLPFYLETPNELPGYAEEISVLRSRYVGQ